MKLSHEEAARRLAECDHGVLATVNAVVGVDAVPVVYAIDAELLAIPIDTIKAKSSIRLQRVRNLEGDPRATLLIEHWDANDWSQLWWVRARLSRLPEPEAADRQALASALAARYPQYRDQPFAHLLVFRITDLSGWAARNLN